MKPTKRLLANHSPCTSTANYFLKGQLNGKSASATGRCAGETFRGELRLDAEPEDGFSSFDFSILTDYYISLFENILKTSLRAWYLSKYANSCLALFSCIELNHPKLPQSPVVKSLMNSWRLLTYKCFKSSMVSFLLFTVISGMALPYYLLMQCAMWYVLN